MSKTTTAHVKDTRVLWLKVKDTLTILAFRKVYYLHTSHYLYHRTLAMLRKKGAKSEQYYKDLENLLNIGDFLKEESNGALQPSGSFFVDKKGRRVNKGVEKVLLGSLERGIPLEYLANFLDNLPEDTSYSSDDAGIWAFLKDERFAITKDGCFLAYKAVDKDYKDYFTGVYDNSVGAVNEMPRESVDINANACCSCGFHVGTFQYALEYRSMGGHLMLCKVSPRDVICTPHGLAGKTRVCKYTVLKEVDIHSNPPEDFYVYEYEPETP